jgi:tetratricopeptide (TPR) repeat protein
MAIAQLAGSPELDLLTEKCSQFGKKLGFFCTLDELTIQREKNKISNEIKELINISPLYGHTADMIFSSTIQNKSSIKKAYTLASNYVDINDLWPLYMNYAKSLQYAGCLQESVDVLNKCISDFGPTIEATSSLVDIYDETGMYQNQIEALKSLIKMKAESNNMDMFKLEYINDAMLFFKEKNINDNEITFFHSTVSEYLTSNYCKDGTSLERTLINENGESWMSYTYRLDKEASPEQLFDFNDNFIDLIIEDETLSKVSRSVVVRFV